MKHAHSLDTPRIPCTGIRPTRALSLWQPWASLCFTRYKRYETRHWPTDYRGPLAIHAAQKLVTRLTPALLDILCDEFGGHWARDLPRGRMLGLVDLAACIRTEHHAAHDVGEIESLTGNWTRGRYGFRLDNPRLFDHPPLARGRQSFFTWWSADVRSAEPAAARLL